MTKEKALEIFASKFMGTSDLKIVEAVKPITKVVMLENKDTLFNENEKADYFYYVISGNIKLSKINLDGKEMIIRIVHSNEIFAEAMLYGRNTYPVNSTAINKTYLLAINISGFKELCYTNQEFILKLFVIMSHQLRYFVDRINDLSSSDTTSRLLKYLHKLKEKTGSSTITLPIPKRDLAMLLGAAPETISRIFAKLQNDGFISFNSKEITILKDINEYTN
ncbi:MAG: Crp/Fnr family transcriptional regulator [Mucispirillum sp.]|nr:Crp/Fnr family transcriptional regulator [Mucispirillum sp.]